ncbi:hypothetical protein [Hallella bergensis]|uniref:hypothetical protein n=1 Tax=Hallella bergensis TaxID=242750 RepID=UPI00399046FB
MKLKVFTICMLCMTVTFVGCKSDKKKDPLRSEYLRPASIDYSGKDSSEIKALVDNYVENFKNKNFQATASMLYTMRNDSILPLSEQDKQKYIDAYSQMPVYDCAVKGIILRSDKNNEVQVSVQISPNGSIDEEKGVTTFCLNPVLKDGKWYLTLLDEYAEGVESVYDKQ